MASIASSLVMIVRSTEDLLHPVVPIVDGAKSLVYLPSMPQDIIAAAKDATKVAIASGKRVDHEAASKLHKKAAKMAFANGDPELAKKHSKIAKDHSKKADKAPDASSSESDDNPLLAWQKKHA